MIGYLLPVALLGCFSATDDQWHGPTNDFALPPRSKSLLMASPRVSRAVADSDFVDVLILADASGSAQSIFEGGSETSDAQPSRQRRLQETDVTYNLAIFVDKPVNTLGELGDTCFRPIMTGAGSLQDLQPFFSSYVPNGGWDWPENQYGALVASLKSPNSFPWMTAYAAPLVILITDSVPHFEGDSYQSLYPDLMPWGDSYDEAGADDYCSQRYYPSAETVRSVILNSGARLGQIIASPTGYNGRALAVAQWLNDYLGQSDDYVIPHRDNTDFYADVQKLIGIFRQELGGTTAAPETGLETSFPETELETSVSDPASESLASHETSIIDETTLV